MKNFQNSLVKTLPCQKQAVSDAFYLLEFFCSEIRYMLGSVVSLTVKENPQDFSQCVK